MAFERVAQLSEIPSGRGLLVRVQGREIGLYKVDGEVFAMDDHCPHAGYSLSAGDLEGTLIMCPGHGWDFDVCTGLGPGVDDGAPIPRYPVRIDGDEVSIDLATPLAPS